MKLFANIIDQSLGMATEETNWVDDQDRAMDHQ